MTRAGDRLAKQVDDWLAENGERLGVEVLAVIRAYLSWLLTNDALEVARSWQKRLSQKPEAAAGEALGWLLARSEGFDPQPGADPPDFECHASWGRCEIECSAILATTAERYTGLPDFDPCPEFRFYRPITDAVLEKLEERAKNKYEPTCPYIIVLSCFNAMAFGTITDPMHVDMFLARMKAKMSRRSWSRFSAIVVIGATIIGLPFRGFMLPNALRPVPTQAGKRFRFQRPGEATFLDSSSANPWGGVLLPIGASPFSELV